MIKKNVLIFLLFYGYGNALHAMHLEQLFGMGISDFGVLRNPNEDDKKAYQEYMSGKAPMVLVADKYGASQKLSRLSTILACIDLAKLRSRGNSLCGPRYTEDELVQDALREHKTMVFSYIREFAVIQSAHGTYCGPKHEEFNKLMAKVIANAIYEPLERVAVLSRRTAQLESDVQRAKSDDEMHLRWWREDSANVKQLNMQLEKLKEKNQKLSADLLLANRTITDKDLFLIELSCDISSLEDAHKDLQAKVAHQEKVAFEVAKETIELEERNEQLQEQSDRSRREKAGIIEHFGKEMERIGTAVSQRHEHTNSAVAALRAEISPLRRALSPLRRQVTTQAVMLEQKDAEIAQLKDALVKLQLEKNKNS